MGSKVGPLGGMDSNSRDAAACFGKWSLAAAGSGWTHRKSLTLRCFDLHLCSHEKTCVFCQEAMENTFQTTRNLPLLEIRTSLVIICVDEMWWTCLYNPTTSFQKPKSTLSPQLAQQNISQRHHKSVSICKALSFLMVRILTGMTRWPFHIISPFRQHPRTEQFHPARFKGITSPQRNSLYWKSNCKILLSAARQLSRDSLRQPQVLAWISWEILEEEPCFHRFFLLRCFNFEDKFYIHLFDTQKHETWKWWKACALAGDLLGCNCNKNTQLTDSLTR